jgi:hypothetical protein
MHPIKRLIRQLAPISAAAANPIKTKPVETAIFVEAFTERLFRRAPADQSA